MITKFFQEDDSVGNIYSNAVPPWMIPDPEDEKDITEIGPTIKDLEKHRMWLDSVIDIYLLHYLIVHPFHNSVTNRHLEKATLNLLMFQG